MHLCGTRFVSSMGLSVLSHLKVARAEVSAWHMAAERNQSMQWSPRVSATVNLKQTARTHQCELQDAADRGPSYWGGSALGNSTGGAFSAPCQHFAMMRRRQEPTDHAVELVEDAKPSQIATSGKLDRFLPVRLELCLGDADAHVPHQLVPCDVGFERRRPGEGAFVEFGVELGLVFYGQTCEDCEYVQQIFVLHVSVTTLP